MTDLVLTPRMATPAYGAGAAALAVLVLTAVHHVYGAIVFETPWRLHILHAAIPVAIIIVAALYFGQHSRETRRGRLLIRLAIVVILAFPVGLIGVYEGGYNHLVKTIVYFAAGRDAALALFPPPTYEMPSDVLFEATGIAQFPLAVWAIVQVRRLAKRYR